MSRVLTFSRKFPAKHPKAGDLTFFVEKIIAGLPDVEELHPAIFTGKYGYDCNMMLSLRESNQIKVHTIRAGNRWKVGDFFSPRVWSVDPYKSKQITIAPDIEIKKIWTFKVNKYGYFINDRDCNTLDELSIVSKNDGLEVDDFENWFAIHPKTKNNFTGQILCWNESIDY